MFVEIFEKLSRQRLSKQKKRINSSYYGVRILFLVFL